MNGNNGNNGEKKPFRLHIDEDALMRTEDIGEYGGRSEPTVRDNAGAKNRSDSNRRGPVNGRKASSGGKNGKKTAAKNGKKRKKKDGNTKLLNTVIYLVVVVAVSVVCAALLMNWFGDMVALGKPDHEVDIQIPEGADTEEVISILKTNEVISSEFAFKMFLKFKGVEDGDFIPGHYILNSNNEYSSIVYDLTNENSELQTVELTFIEGGTYLDYIKQLADAGVCDEASLKNEMENVSKEYRFLNDYPTDSSDIIYKFEGYMFPNKYEFYKGESAVSVYGRFLNSLNLQITDADYQQAESLGMTMHEVLTLASIIQKEAASTDDMAMVSSVFHNRLSGDYDIAAMLQSDPTVWYPYDSKEDAPDASYVSKYSTYDNEGLPPGPICNPGYDAIYAALHPADTNYLYFVVDDDGNFYYSETYAHHREICDELGLESY